MEKTKNKKKHTCIIENVPFYANTEDNTHCVQAAFKSILKYFIPEKDFSFEELDKLTHKSPNKGTWWFPAEIEFVNMGFTVKAIGSFDYRAFQEKGTNYLYEKLGKEEADWYIKKSNLLDVAHFIPNYLKQVQYEVRKAVMEDFESMLEKGYLLISDVNARVLQNKSGFVSHAIPIFGYDDNHIYFHDPGLPPSASMKVTKKKFIEAGGDSFVAIKL